MTLISLPGNEGRKRDWSIEGAWAIFKEDFLCMGLLFLVLQEDGPGTGSCEKLEAVFCFSVTGSLPKFLN